MLWHHTGQQLQCRVETVDGKLRAWIEDDGWWYVDLPIDDTLRDTDEAVDIIVNNCMQYVALEPLRKQLNG